MKATLPLFPGFYESELSNIIDLEEERRQEEDGEIPPVDYAASRIAISKVWVEALNDELGTAFEFDELISPKEYTFETDTIVVEVNEADTVKLDEVMESDTFRRVVAEELRPRSGFMPYYSNDIEDGDWQRPLSEWSAVQVSLLIQAMIHDTIGADSDSAGDFAHLLMTGRLDYKFHEAVV